MTKNHSSIDHHYRQVRSYRKDFSRHPYGHDMSGKRINNTHRRTSPVKSSLNEYLNTHMNSTNSLQMMNFNSLSPEPEKKKYTNEVMNIYKRQEKEIRYLKAQLKQQYEDYTKIRSKYFSSI
jgi:hypothetical protein